MSAATGAMIVGVGTGDMVQHTGPVKLVSAPSHEQIGRLEVLHTDGASFSMKWLCRRFRQMVVCACGQFCVVEREENSRCKVDCVLGSRPANWFQWSHRSAVSSRRGGIYNLGTNHSLGAARRGNDIDTRTHFFGFFIEHKIV